MKISTKAILFLGLAPTFLFSNQLDKSVKVIEKSNKKLNSYQKQIDKNEEITDSLLGDYKYTYNNLKNTKKYNEQLNKIVLSQEEELKSLNEQISGIDKTQKNILPLMEKMIKSLKILVAQDLPFLKEEREKRIAKLENSLDRADIKTSEKYRIILEAFKIEYDYAKSIEAYQEKIANKTYNILRLGRTAMYYQSLDLNEYAYYDKNKKSWIKIEDYKAKSNIRKALKIANKQQNVSLLTLPLSTKKENK